MNPRRAGAVARRIVLGFRHDRRSLALLFVARHEAGALERLALAVLLRGARLTGAKTVQADAPGERISAERADLDLFQVERGVLLELLVDDVLKLQRGELEDVVRGDLLGCDLELLLRE